jgi:hypothetical protein
MAENYHPLDHPLDHIRREPPRDLKDRLFREVIEDPCFPYEPVLINEVFTRTTGDKLWFHQYDALRDRQNPTERWFGGEPSFVLLLWSLRSGEYPKKPETLQNHLGAAGNTPNPPDTSRPIRPNAERNKWLYDQYVTHPEKTLTAIRSDAKKKGWSLASDAALRGAVKSHCDSLGIPMPTRKKSRIKLD